MKLGGGVEFYFHPATNINKNDECDSSLSLDFQLLNVQDFGGQIS